MPDAQTSIEVVQPAEVRREVSSGTVRTAKKKQAAPPRTELQLLGDISAKLDRVVAVLAAGQAKDRDQQVEILAAAGCDSTFIGGFVNLAPGRVRQLEAWRKVHVSGGEDGQ